MQANDNGASLDNPYGLTQREVEVVTLLVGGRTGKDVASLLHVDRRAIARLRAAAMLKFRAKNGVQLAHLVAVAGLSAIGASVVSIEDIQSPLAV